MIFSFCRILKNEDSFDRKIGYLATFSEMDSKYDFQAKTTLSMSQARQPSLINEILRVSLIFSSFTVVIKAEMSTFRRFTVISQV